MKHSPPSNPQTVLDKILVIFPGALGDFICFLPALGKLASDHALDLLARAEYAALTPSNVHTRSLQRYEISRLFVAGAEEDERLKKFFGVYRLIYSWTGSRQPDFVRRLQVLSRNKLRVFPFRPSKSEIRISDYYLDCVGVKDSWDRAPAIPSHPDALRWSRRFWRQNELEEKRLLILAPGSGAKEKNWPLQFYRALAEEWQKKLGDKVLVILGPAEEDRNETESWNNALVVRGLDLAKITALLVRGRLYVGNDSGITHLAAALGVKTVALFGPTDPRQWAPRGKRVTVITRNIGCSPCADSLRKVCPHRECLTGLSPRDVLERIEELLKRA